MTKEQVIEAIKSADISIDGWLEFILRQMDDKFAAGYLTAKASVYSNSLFVNEEDFRDCMVAVCKFHIWDR